MNRSERVASLVPPLILVLVALISMWQTSTRDQSSWSGAGFGMFATIDGEATRQVRAYVEETGQPLPLPADLQRLELEVRVLPSVSRVEKLGRAWASHSGLPDHAVLAIEVWGIDFDASSGELRRFLLRRVEVET